MLEKTERLKSEAESAIATLGRARTAQGSVTLGPEQDAGRGGLRITGRSRQNREQHPFSGIFSQSIGIWVDLVS
jgi:hypothetical protein